jgi:hypothetical protein
MQSHTHTRARGEGKKAFFFVFFIHKGLFQSCLIRMDTVMVETSNTISRVYSNVNLDQPSEYYEYEKLQVEWG